MSLHRNIYSFVYRGEHCPESKDVIWIHHQTKDDLQSPIIAEIWIKNEWRPFLWGDGAEATAECCCCGSPFVRDEGKSSAAMRAASNVARGAYSLSAGYKSLAMADNSVAIGKGVVSDYENEIVLGNYNERSGPYKFVIGIGENDADRRNALVITQDDVIMLYNSQNGEYYSVGQIINSIGRGEVLEDNLLMSKETVEIVPDV